MPKENAGGICAPRSGDDSPRTDARTAKKRAVTPLMKDEDFAFTPEEWPVYRKCFATNNSRHPP
jgi:hypothetical protein